jgi:hypothetical protein
VAGSLLALPTSTLVFVAPVAHPRRGLTSLILFSVFWSSGLLNPPSPKASRAKKSGVSHLCEAPCGQDD